MLEFDYELSVSLCAYERAKAQGEEFIGKSMFRTPIPTTPRNYREINLSKFDRPKKGGPRLDGEKGEVIRFLVENKADVNQKDNE